MNRIIVGQSEFRQLPEDTYFAELKRIEAGIGGFKNPVYYPWFEILQAPYELCPIKAIMNQERAGAQNSKFCKMVRALLNRPLQKGESIAPNDLIGKRCYIKVERKGKNNDITQYIAESDLADIVRSIPGRGVLRSGGDC